MLSRSVSNKYMYDNSHCFGLFILFFKLHDVMKTVEGAKMQSASCLDHIIKVEK